jgi:branched-chain amino acid transport system substrate-binding protein
MPAPPALSTEVYLPVRVPLTGFVALEGTSERNGALLAASQMRDVTFTPGRPILRRHPKQR